MDGGYGESVRGLFGYFNAGLCDFILFFANFAEEEVASTSEEKKHRYGTRAVISKYPPVLPT